jgi:hypothetical protein
LLFLIASLINTTQIDYSSQWVTFDNVYSLVIFGLCLILPFVLVVSACIKYDQLKDGNSPQSQNWGASMEGIKMPRVLSEEEKSAFAHAINNRHKLSKPVAIIAGHMNYLKDAVLVLILVFLRDHPWS